MSNDKRDPLAAREKRPSTLSDRRIAGMARRVARDLRPGRVVVTLDQMADMIRAEHDLFAAGVREGIIEGVRRNVVHAAGAGKLLLKAKKLMPHGAYAEIVYPKDNTKPRQRGELLYLKPWLPPGAPLELAAFKRLRPDFPHGTTANEFFTESDFESYRNLGDHLTTNILEAHPKGPLTLDRLFKALRQAPSSADGPMEWQHGTLAQSAPEKTGWLRDLIVLSGRIYPSQTHGPLHAPNSACAYSKL